MSPSKHPSQTRLQLRKSGYPEGRRLRMLLKRDPSRPEATLVAESADDLAGPWTELARSESGEPFSGPGYVSGDNDEPGVKVVELRDAVAAEDDARRFLRVRVERQ